MRKRQSPNYVVYLGLTLSFFTTISIAQSRPATQLYLNSKPNVYLLSSNNFCHGPLSDDQASVLLRAPLVAGGKPANAYFTLDSCKAAGGQLTEIEALKLQAEQFVAIQKVTKEKEQEVQNEQNKKDFYGFNWAPGIAVMFYDSPYIDDIRIESTGEGDEQINRVYIDKEVRKNIAVVLETHYLWQVEWSAIRDTGFGLFASTNLIKEEGAPLSTFAAGFMFSVRDKDSSNGLSVGLGWFIDTDFKTLRNGLTDGDETTYQNTEKLLRKVDEEGLMFVISSKF